MSDLIEKLIQKLSEVEAARGPAKHILNDEREGSERNCQLDLTPHCGREGVMRPDSYREQLPEERCGTCRFCHEIKFKRDDLCFFGEENLIKIGEKDWDGEWITFIEDDLTEIDGDSYSHIWAARNVDLMDVCDQWEARDE